LLWSSAHLLEDFGGGRKRLDNGLISSATSDNLRLGIRKPTNVKIYLSNYWNILQIAVESFGWQSSVGDCAVGSIVYFFANLFVDVFELKN
jgi:hypothetical protein